MTTFRLRLTFWYSLALGATILVFGATLYLDRRVSSVREVDQRVVLEADLSAGWLAESRRVLGQLTTTIQGQLTLDPNVSAFFEGFRDYIVITGPDGQPLFLSVEARALPSEAIVQLLELAAPTATRRQGSVSINPAVGSARYLVVPVPGARDEVGAVLVAVGMSSVLFGPGALLRSIALSLPIILLGSVLLGYILAGRALRQLESMITELEAISDGRSLHRRLAVPQGNDEMARLALAANRTFARLERSFDALHHFIADASHELKTPLMVLRAGVERALTNPRNPPENLEALDTTLAEINQMTELVENLLTLARADEGRAQLAVEPCDLRELVSEAAETAGILAEEAGLTVSTEIPDSPVALSADKARIRQLLLNLATNAVKYTPAGGTVRLELTDQPDQVVLVVRDSGIGIAPGDLPHIFRRFWRGDPARSRAGQPTGSGLGLAITQWIAEAHGGSIDVQSRPGRGTAFTVTLPRTAAAAESP